VSLFCPSLSLSIGISASLNNIRVDLFATTTKGEREDRGHFTTSHFIFPIMRSQIIMVVTRPHHTLLPKGTFDIAVCLSSGLYVYEKLVFKMHPFHLKMSE